MLAVSKVSVGDIAVVEFVFVAYAIGVIRMVVYLVIENLKMINF